MFKGNEMFGDVQYLPSMHEALDSVFSTENGKKKKTKDTKRFSVSVFSTVGQG